jgi:hypothetical protein
MVQSYVLVAIMEDVIKVSNLGILHWESERRSYSVHEIWTLAETTTLGFFLGVKTHVVVCRGSNNALPNHRRVWTRILHDTVQIGS